MNEIDNRSRKHSNGAVELTKKFKRQLFFQKILKSIVVLFGLIILFIICFISFSSPIREGITFYIPKNETALIGEKVMITDEKDSIIDRFNNAIFGPTNLRYGEIIAGPNGVINENNNKVTIVDNDGKSFESNIKLIDRDKFLQNEYIIRCTSGSCVKGQDEIVNEKQVKIIK